MGLYGSTFYTMTGFHGLSRHVRRISMAYLYFTKALPGKYTSRTTGIETVGLYWHSSISCGSSCSPSST